MHGVLDREQHELGSLKLVIIHAVEGVFTGKHLTTSPGKLQL